jgi:hypothetical protein
MAPVIQGVNDMTLVSTFKRHTREKGTQSVEEWRGPRAKAETFFENARSDINAFNTTYDEVEWEDGGGFGIVRLLTNEDDDPNNEDDNAVWELIFEQEFVPLAQHPYFTSVSGSINIEIRNCEQAIARGDAYVSSASAFPTEMGQYYGLRLHGVQGAIVSLPVIRKTVTLSNRSTITAATQNVDTKQTLAEIGPPPAKLGDLSSWEWLKRAPRLLSRDGGKSFEIVYEFAGEKATRGWSTVLYGGSWNPTA